MYALSALTTCADLQPPQRSPSASVCVGGGRQYPGQGGLGHLSRGSASCALCRFPPVCTLAPRLLSARRWWCLWAPAPPSRSPALFLILLATSAITSAFKVSLPLAKSGSTMSVSYAVDFASLLLLGPNETMLVAVTSAWSQCTFRMKVKNPVYRTLFSMACLAITVQAAGFAYELAGRRARRPGARHAGRGPAARRRRRRPTSCSTRS